MVTSNIIFYLILFALIIEIVKTSRIKLRKSKTLVFTQLIILFLASLIIINYIPNKIFLIFPVLIAIIVIVSWIGYNVKNANLRIILLGLLFSICLILIGLAFVIYGLVRS